jgi:hypothetical protein
MTVVRSLFILMLAVHLAGVPAAAVSPCAARAAEPHGCCMRHQTDSGGDVIGYCACQTPSRSGEVGSVVSTPVPSPEGLGAAVLTAAGVADAVSEPGVGLPAVFAGPAGAGPSPPRLSGAGFRC